MRMLIVMKNERYREDDRYKEVDYYRTVTVDGIRGAFTHFVNPDLTLSRKWTVSGLDTGLSMLTSKSFATQEEARAVFIDNVQNKMSKTVKARHADACERYKLAIEAAKIVVPAHIDPPKGR